MITAGITGQLLLTICCSLSYVFIPLLSLNLHEGLQIVHKLQVYSWLLVQQ